MLLCYLSQARAHQHCDIVLHVHTVDGSDEKSRVAGLPRVGPHRLCFWRECVIDLSNQLKQLPASGGGQALLTLPMQTDVSLVIKTLVAELSVALEDSNVSVEGLYTHQELCTEEIAAQHRVRKSLAQMKPPVPLFECWGANTVHHGIPQGVRL